MTLDDIRYGVTVLSFLVFAGIVVWALSPRRKRDFAEAEQLPFNGDSQ